MAKKVSENKTLAIALFLIGLVMLVEAAATIFVLVEAPSMMSASISWVYVLLKGVVSLYVLFVGFKMMKK